MAYISKKRLPLPANFHLLAQAGGGGILIT